jgi:hypothetical protein
LILSINYQRQIFDLVIRTIAISPFLQLVIELVIILLAAKVADYIAMRLGQPSVLGELTAGVLLGPS